MHQGGGVDGELQEVGSLGLGSLGREEIQVEPVSVGLWANRLEGAQAQEGSSWLSCWVTLDQPLPPCASAVKELGEVASPALTSRSVTWLAPKEGHRAHGVAS